METSVSHARADNFGKRSPVILYKESLDKLNEWRGPINDKIDKTTLITKYPRKIDYWDGDDRCNLLFQPIIKYSQHKNLCPTVIFFHGGAWVTGESKDFYFLTKHWRKWNLVIHNYIRMVDGQQNMQHTMQSVIEAILYTRNHLIGHGAPLYLMGHSAGAHLAAFATTLLRVDGFIGLSGIYNLKKSSLVRNVGEHFPDQDFDPWCAGRFDTLASKVLLSRGDQEDHIHHHIRYLQAAWDVDMDVYIPYNTDHFTIIHELVNRQSKLYQKIEEFING